MPLRALALALVLLVAALAAGCDGGGSGGEGTPAASPESTMGETTPTAQPTAAPDIRQQDLKVQPELESFLTSSNGVVDPTGIIYADLTEDGVDDAVVPVSSGGEGGDIAVFVFGYQPAGLVQLLRFVPEGGSLAVSVEDQRLVTREPVFSTGDPACCPSELHVTTYEWKASQLTVANEETVPAEGN